MHCAPSVSYTHLDVYKRQAETTYTVTESDNAGYMVTSTGDIGTIKAGKTVQVQYENYKDSSSSGGSSGGGEHHYYTCLLYTSRCV